MTDPIPENPQPDPSEIAAEPVAPAEDAADGTGETEPEPTGTSSDDTPSNAPGENDDSAGLQDPEPQKPHQRFDLSSDRDAALEAAVAAVRAGECIVLPTDTVYGIGADASNAAAVQRLLDAKRRGRDMPPPVLIAETGMLKALATHVNDLAVALAEKFWPGALTLILDAPTSLRMDLGDTAGTIALRVPDHEATRDLLRRTGPLAVSSANVSGEAASTRIDDAVAQLGDSVSVYLDAGPTPGNVPSTIVDFARNPLGRIVREGVLTLDQLKEADAFLEPMAVPDTPAEEPEPTETPATENAEPTSANPTDEPEETAQP